MFGEENYQAIFMSGSDYPIKSSNYIKKYIEQNYPCNYISQSDFSECTGAFRTLVFNNLYNYWFSFENTKLKIEVKPFCYIRPRCFKHIKSIPIIKIFKLLPKVIIVFFRKKNLLDFKKLKWVTSETWMSLCGNTVKKLLAYIEEHKECYKSVGGGIHNPEEILLQSIINTIEKDVPRKEMIVCTEYRLLNNGDLQLENKDVEFVLNKVKEERFLFLRKLSYPKNKELLDFIDSKILKEKQL